MTTITAHGATYADAAAANARIAELNTINAELGASDGRVTEILSITEALQAAGLEQAPARPRPDAAAALGPVMTAHVINAQTELAALKRHRLDDGQWRYLKVRTADGRTVSREYRTQQGFLTAFIREALRGSDILIAE